MVRHFPTGIKTQIIPQVATSFSYGHFQSFTIGVLLHEALEVGQFEGLPYGLIGESVEGVEVESKGAREEDWVLKGFPIHTQLNITQFVYPLWLFATLPVE